MSLKHFQTISSHFHLTLTRTFWQCCPKKKELRLFSPKLPTDPRKEWQPLFPGDFSLAWELAQQPSLNSLATAGLKRASLGPVITQTCGPVTTETWVDSSPHLTTPSKRNAVMTIGQSSTTSQHDQKISPFYAFHIIRSIPGEKERKRIWWW